MAEECPGIRLTCHRQSILLVYVVAEVFNKQLIENNLNETKTVIYMEANQSN